jgi:hypothetical protein
MSFIRSTVSILSAEMSDLGASEYNCILKIADRPRGL